MFSKNRSQEKLVLHEEEILTKTVSNEMSDLDFKILACLCKIENLYPPEKRALDIKLLRLQNRLDCYKYLTGGTKSKPYKEAAECVTKIQKELNRVRAEGDRIAKQEGLFDELSKLQKLRGQLADTSASSQTDLKEKENIFSLQ